MNAKKRAVDAARSQGVLSDGWSFGVIRRPPNRTSHLIREAITQISATEATTRPHFTASGQMAAAQAGQPEVSISRRICDGVGIVRRVMPPI